MISLKTFTLSMLTVLALVACQPENPPLTGVAPPPVQKWNFKPVEISAAGLTISVDRRVDILFVVDDSQSMAKHQTSLSENIHEFVDKFASDKASNIDFHIAYTYVHDRKRYGPLVQPTCGGILNWEIPGTLKTFVNDSQGRLQLPENGRRYLTNKDKDFKQILKASLDPKSNPSLIKALVNEGPCPRGAENEESFTPLLAAVENPVPPANAGFRRAGAFFVAIILSDAKDESGLSPEEVARRLDAATRDAAKPDDKRFRVYSVAIGPGTIISNDPKAIGTTHNDEEVCQPDPIFSDSIDGRHYTRTVGDGSSNPLDKNPLVDLARLTQDGTSKEDQVLSICSKTYGKALGDFGVKVQQDVIKDVSVDLVPRPLLFKRLRVFLGETELKEGSQWDYNTQGPKVVVHSKEIDWSLYPNEVVHVYYTPVDGTRGTTNFVRP